MMAMDATAMSRSTSDAQQGAHWSGVARCLEFSFLQMMAMDGTAMSRSTSDAWQGAHWSGVARALE